MKLYEIPSMSRLSLHGLLVIDCIIQLVVQLRTLRLNSVKKNLQTAQEKCLLKDGWDVQWDKNKS